MKKTVPDLLEQVIKNLGLQRTLRLNELTIKIACLIREEDVRPLRAKWWHGKEAYIIGVDLDGNFILRHCDGSVRYWNHSTQSDSVIAKSVRDFLQELSKSEID